MIDAAPLPAGAAVRVQEENEPYYWLAHPERHYETVAGARYAPLLCLEDML